MRHGKFMVLVVDWSRRHEGLRRDSVLWVIYSSGLQTGTQGPWRESEGCPLGPSYCLKSTFTQQKQPGEDFQITSSLRLILWTSIKPLYWQQSHSLHALALWLSVRWAPLLTPALWVFFPPHVCLKKLSVLNAPWMSITGCIDVCGR